LSWPQQELPGLPVRQVPLGLQELLELGHQMLKALREVQA
jgi:hypothetical protein